MILRPEQIKLLALGLTATPANAGGGSSSSQANQETTNTTTNFVNEADKRVVASDQAIGLSGDGNTVTRTSYASTDNSTHFADNSVHNTTTNTTTNYTSTDYGSVSAALTGMQATAEGALHLSGDAISSAVDSIKASGDNQLSALTKALGFASTAMDQAHATANDVLGYAQQSISQASDAFAQAKQPEEKIMYALIAAMAVMAIAFAVKK